MAVRWVIPTLLCVLAFSLGSAPSGAAPASACGGTPDPAEITEIAALSAPRPASGPTLDRLEDAIARHHRITEILIDNRDRRGLFALGLDTVEYAAVLPLQRDPTAFADREYAHQLSLDLLDRFLATVHAEFTGAPTEPHWAHYFALAADCGVPGTRVAMAGYNAHITVDLAHTVAATGSRPENAPDYFKIVDAIARTGDLIVERTHAEYGVDLGPLWRFYFVGEGLDAVVGRGVASGELLRAADLGYNVVVFGNGLALQNPNLAAATEAEIAALWSSTEAAFDVLVDLGGL